MRLGYFWPHGLHGTVNGYEDCNDLDAYEAAIYGSDVGVQNKLQAEAEEIAIIALEDGVITPTGSYTWTSETEGVADVVVYCRYDGSWRTFSIKIRRRILWSVEP